MTVLTDSKNSLSLSAVSVTLRDKTILQPLSIKLPLATLVVIAGPNGAGKSTLLRCFAGTQDGAFGSVKLDGESLSALTGRERAKKIAWAPPLAQLPFDFTVQDVIMMGRFPWHQGRPQKKDMEKVRGAMKMMEIEAFAARSLRTLSSGEQQKTAIARVLASDAKIILLDEPCANLDMAAALRVLQKLQELRATGHSVLLTLHDLNLAARFADYGLILRGGQLVAAGKDVFNRQHFAAAFDIKAEEALTATGKVSWHFEVDL